VVVAAGLADQLRIRVTDQAGNRSEVDIPRFTRANADGSVSTGVAASGGLIEWIGYPLTISGLAGVGLVFTLLIGIKWRASIWRRRRASTATSAPQRA